MEVTCLNPRPLPDPHFLRKLHIETCSICFFRQFLEQYEVTLHLPSNKKKPKKLKNFYNFAIFNYLINKFNVYPVPSTSQSERIFFVFSIRAWRVRTSKYRFWKKRPWKISILGIKINFAKIFIIAKNPNPGDENPEKTLNFRDSGIAGISKFQDSGNSGSRKIPSQTVWG